MMLSVVVAAIDTHITPIIIVTEGVCVFMANCRYDEGPKNRAFFEG